MKTILFQGDSITDADRNYQQEYSLGCGYPLLTAGKIAVDFPGKYQMLNRGISGNKIVDLYARIKRDFINIKPDYISILIGVNDVWHELSNNDGVDAEKFHRIYEQLIIELRKELPSVTIILMEPFVLPGSGTDAYYDRFNDEVILRANATREIAAKYGLIFVPLQEKLRELAAACSDSQILSDGVHPTTAGHELISRELYKVYREIL